MMRAGHVVGRQTKTRNLERNLQERRWEIKQSPSTPALILQTCSSLFHAGSSMKQTPSNTFKKCFRENDYGEKNLLLQLRPKRVQQGHQVVLDPKSPSELPGISWKQTCLCVLPPTVISWEQPVGSMAPAQTMIGFQSTAAGASHQLHSLPSQI